MQPLSITPSTDKNTIVVARGYPYGTEFNILENVKTSLSGRTAELRVDLIEDEDDLSVVLDSIEDCDMVALMGFENTSYLLDPSSGLSCKRVGNPGQLRVSALLKAFERKPKLVSTRIFVLLIDRNTVLDKAITRPGRLTAFMEYTNR